MSVASALYKVGNFYYLNLSSDSVTNTNTSETKNSDFTNEFGSGGISFPEPMDVALASLSTNVSGQSGIDAVPKLDVYVLCSVARPTVRVGDQQVNSLKRVLASQSNSRENWEFDSPLQFIPVNTSTFNSIRIQLVTDSFRSAGLPHTLHATHSPVGDNPSSCTLVFRPHQTIVSGDS